MAVKIIWSDEAEKTFDDNLQYLFKEWSEREVLFFLKQASNVFSRLQKHPESYPPSPKSNKVRRARVKSLLHLKKRNSLALLVEYEARPISIEILI
jgi:plasmid stabilization system protein ParE